MQVIKGIAISYAAIAVLSASAQEVIRKGLDGLQVILSWVVQEELEALRTLVEFLLGKKFLEEINPAHILGALYVVTRFMFLGACLGMISGVKLILGVLWGALFVTRIAFRS
jgi:hypothetical protein